jgi:hypothetical protein
MTSLELVEHRRTQAHRAECTLRPSSLEATCPQRGARAAM